MKSFHWNQNFETGLDEVDLQHHHLIDIINRFGTLLTEGRLQFEDLQQIFKELSDYTVYHFQEEEKLMKGIKVDSRHLARHIEEHKHFLAEVESIFETIQADSLQKANVLMQFLSHWLAFHILGDDQDMARQIELIESGTNPEEAFSAIKREKVGATATLLEALNGLFDLVTKRNKELKEFNESLEEKIALRTQELSKANQSLEELSLTDVLTKLPNRRHGMRQFSAVWEESSREKTPLVCMMLDADHFKEINDSYGHDAGDRVLIELAKTLQYAIRSDDFVCRLGGDEFFIICPKTDLKGGMHLAEMIRTNVSKLRVPTGGDPWHGSISVGVACRKPEMSDFEELIKQADQGVYAAKDAGKNCVRTVC